MKCFYNASLLFYKEQEEKSKIRLTTLSLRWFEILFGLHKSNECQTNNIERSIFWLQTSLIKLRSAIPSVNLVYNILREPLGILSIFYLISVVDGPSLLWFSPGAIVGHEFYFYYRQIWYLNNVRNSQYKYICFIYITFVLFFLRKINIFVNMYCEIIEKKYIYIYIY